MTQQVENLNPNTNTKNMKMTRIQQEKETDDFVKLIRKSTRFDASNRFQTNFTALSSNSHLQYSEIYSSRIATLGPLVRENCLLKWPREKESPRIAALSLLLEGNSNDLISSLDAAPKGPAAITSAIAWVVGTVYVDMPLKECVLNEITREQWVDAPKLREKYVDCEADKVILEDESGRVVLGGKNLRKFLICTGMIIGALGKQLEDGTFQVLDICFPLLAPQAPIPKNQEESWVAFVSGLEIGAEDSLDFKLQLFSDWITGELGDKETQDTVSKISRLVIVGNSLSSPCPETQKTIKNKFGRMVVQYDGKPLQNLDEFLTGIVSGIDVDLMAGANDPTTHLLPQRPIHPSLLQDSHNYSTLNSVTNPYLVTTASGTEILCTSGQVVDDIYKYVDTHDRLGIATVVVGCGNVSPTSPDTLWTSPSSQDAFIMHRVPHLFVVGNQPEFKTRLVRACRGRIGEDWKSESEEEDGVPGEGEECDMCRVVLVPKFHESGGVVLVRLDDTLETKIIYFKQASSRSTVTDI